MSLPKTLPETYERILRKIQSEQADAAIAILTWLCFSYETLSSEEVAQTVALRKDKSRYSYFPDEVIDPEDILFICSSLVKEIDVETPLRNSLHSTKNRKGQSSRI